MAHPSPETPFDPNTSEALEERAIHGADEIAHSIEEAEPEDRSALVQAVAPALEEQGLIIVDLHDVQKALGGFNPDSLPGVIGRSGKTRAQFLAELSLRGPRQRHPRR